MRILKVSIGLSHTHCTYNKQLRHSYEKVVGLAEEIIKIIVCWEIMDELYSNLISSAIVLFVMPTKTFLCFFFFQFMISSWSSFHILQWLLNGYCSGFYFISFGQHLSILFSLWQWFWSLTYSYKTNLGHKILHQERSIGVGGGKGAYYLYFFPLNYIYTKLNYKGVPPSPFSDEIT